MQHNIIGTTMPVVEIQLDPGESIVSESGELSWMTQSITMRTSTSAGGQGGFMKKLKRMAGGGGLFLTEYAADGAPGSVSFATHMPGQILPVQVTPEAGYMVHKHGFLCATPGIEISAGFQKSLGAGVFGGEGFILQKLGGAATAWIELDGEIVVRDLAPGETLRAHPGHIGMFTQSTQFTITTVPGIKNKLFGGDGLFLAALTGPGRVWLQSLPLANLAHSIAPYLPRAEAAPRSGGGISLGGMLGN